ncbi:hypothetical protein VCR15J2_70064 [Vibrio coralliirubri]|nr:hypothetical protein VCR15J2_70064 [Vibrio coralliirubri]
MCNQLVTIVLYGKVSKTWVWAKEKETQWSPSGLLGKDKNYELIAAC